MDAEEQIKKFTEFMQDIYKEEIVKAIKEGRRFIVVDFKELTRFSVELSEDLLDNPEDTIKAAEIALDELDLEKQENFRVRFKNLPENQHIMIRDIRAKHINKLIAIRGVVRQKSDVRPQVTSARFECPSCGATISVIQLDKKFREPTRCGCGRKGKFRLLSKELVDAQGIVLEELTTDLEGGEQPKRINLFLKEDLVSPMTDKKTNPGTALLIVGILKEVPLTGRDGGQLTKFDLIVEVNYLEPMEEDLYNVEISPEEVKEIKELSKDPRVFEKLWKSFAPGIYGHDIIKQALILQFLGGVHKIRDDGVRNRGDIHILLVGDPGAGKSQLLKRAQVVAPKARYVSGKGASGAGLTASVVKDEFMGGWSLEAGALVLANNGVCMIDEMDKMSPEDRAAMHEALEQQTVTISKANIQATLRSQTTVLAAANPKLGRFDPYGIIAEQINLPPSLINRFDLIFPIRDLPDKDKDEKLAGFVLNLHQESDTSKTEVSTELLRKYISYARQHSKPVLSNEAIEVLKKFYVKIRNSDVSSEKGIRSVPISARQLEALVRLAEASAKVRLDSEVRKEDAQKAIELLEFCLHQVGIDPETGKIDIDRISTGVTFSERTKLISIKEIINELEKKFGEEIPIKDIIEEASARGMSQDKAEDAIERLKRQGDIYEPKRGFIQKV